MIEVKKNFTIKKSALSRKFRTENNNLDFSSLIEETGYQVARIGDLARTHRTERNKKSSTDTSFRYVQISDIDVELGYEPLAELLRRPDLAGWIGMTLVGTWLLSCVSWCHP